jgi:hypothetical protein
MVLWTTTPAGPRWTRDRDRAAATEGRSSPWEHLEKEGAEGNVTMGEGGHHRGGARPATMDQNGGGLELGGAGLGAWRRGDGVGDGYGGVWQGQGSLL